MRRGVVFDFDGVLADSEGLHLAAFQDVLSARGWTLARATYFDRYLGFDDRDLIQAFLDDHNLQVADAELDAIVAEKGRRNTTRACRVATSFFRRRPPVWRACGAPSRLALRRARCTSEIADILRANNLEHAFQVVVGADDVARSKPAPDSYAEAVRRLDVRPEHAVAIEDSHWGLTAARAAGLHAIGITTSYPRHALHLADAVIDSLDEVTPDSVARLLDGSL